MVVPTNVLTDTDMTEEIRTTPGYAQQFNSLSHNKRSSSPNKNTSPVQYKGLSLSAGCTEARVEKFAEQLALKNPIKVATKLTTVRKYTSTINIRTLDSQCENNPATGQCQRRGCELLSQNELKGPE